MPTNNRRADRHFIKVQDSDRRLARHQPRPTARRTNTRQAAIAAAMKEQA
jgi:hypothetical protein